MVADTWNNSTVIKLGLFVITRSMVLLSLVGVVTSLIRLRSSNGVARTLKKLRTSRETTESSSTSLQLRPFSKWDLLLKEIICSKRERIISFNSSSLLNEKSLLSH